MTVRAWLVGQNEAAILGQGWYDRCPDWFGLPFRESFPEAEIRLSEWREGDRLHLLCGSYLAALGKSQELRLEWGSSVVAHTLSQENQPAGWQWVSIDSPRPGTKGGSPPLRLVLEKWTHGEWEEVEDYRPVGIVFGGIFLTTS
jgi:hypothetical protein